MENTEKIDTTKRPEEDTRDVTPGCPWWIFGDETSAQKDIDKHVEIIDK